jgi:Cu(I)/Ag(I) efflux system membrane fusion protein
VHESRERLAVLDRKIRQQTLVAPISGTVTTRDLDQMLGSYLVEGGHFCTVDRLDTVRLAIATPESDIEVVREGVRVRMAAKAYPGRTLVATVLAVSPIARPPQLDEREALDLVQRVNLVRVLVEIENSDGRLHPGMTGRVQFLGDPRSALGKTWWNFRRWAETIVW